MLSDMDMILAIRHRLGLYVAYDLSLAHSCGLCGQASPSSSPSSLPRWQHDHFHSCQVLRGGVVTTRHNRVLRLVGQLAREAHCYYWEEPRALDSQGGRKGRTTIGQSIRPDAIISTHDERFMIDVSVINPTSESYSIGKPGAAARSREQQKTRKYKQLAELEQCKFVPFVLESYGTWGRSATKLLRVLSEQYSQDENLARVWYRRAIVAVTFALQAGNAWVGWSGATRWRSQQVHRVRRVVH